jgi:hypothetical protein
MGSGPSTTLQPEYFSLRFGLFQGLFGGILNPSNFLHACFLGCLINHSNHQPLNYDASRKILISSATMAFSFFRDLDGLMKLLARRKSLSILRTNNLFMKVMSMCLENPNFPRPTCFMFRSSDSEPYLWSNEILEIFFQTLTTVLRTELKKLNILDEDVENEQREHIVINLDSFHSEYQRLFMEHHNCPIELIVNGMDNFLDHQGVFNLFLAMLQNSIDTIGIYSNVKNIFFAPKWFAENLEQKWIDMLTNGVSRIENPGNFSREFIDDWVNKGRPCIEQ